MGLNDEILDYEEAESRKKSLLRESWSLNFFLIFWEVSEQSDQVARKPDF